jgi:hypothetical protein
MRVCRYHLEKLFKDNIDDKYSNSHTFHIVRHFEMPHPNIGSITLGCGDIIGEDNIYYEVSITSD